MSRAGWTIARRRLIRLALLTASLAPLVTVVLMGLSRLRRDAPEWVFWQAELIFVIALEYVYEATVVLALTGVIVLGGLFVVRRRVGASQPVVARLLVLCVTLLTRPRDDRTGVARAGFPERIGSPPCRTEDSARPIVIYRRCGSRSPSLLNFAPSSPTRPATARSIWS